MQLLVFFPFHAPIYSFSFFWKEIRFPSLFSISVILAVLVLPLWKWLASKCSSKLLQDTQVRTSAAAIFLCLQQQNEREGTKDSASHKHDSSNLSALPLESYDLVTKKKAP